MAAYKHLARYCAFVPADPTAVTPGTSPTYAAVTPSLALFQGGYAIDDVAATQYRITMKGIYKLVLGGTHTIATRLYDVTNSAAIITSDALVVGAFGAEYYFVIAKYSSGPLGTFPSGDARLRWEMTVDNPAAFSVLKVISVDLHVNRTS